MKRLSLLLGLLLLACSPTTTAQQGNTNPGVIVSGSVTPNNCTKLIDRFHIADAGAPCGSGGGGVASFNTRTGAVVPASGDYTCTLIGGAPSCSTDTTNAANISSGTLNTARLPIIPLANGGLGASQASATANQIPVFPGGGGAAAPTSMTTFFDSLCSTTVGQFWVRQTGGWGCTSLGYVNPVWWGAIGNGSTDNTTAFNNAIAALATRGGLMLIPPGDYCLKTITSNNSAFVISTNWSVRIEGQGGGRGAVTLDACGINLTPVYFDAGEKSTLAHLQILGFGAPTDTTLPTVPALSVPCVSAHCGGGNLVLDDIAVFYGNPPMKMTNNPTCVIRNSRFGAGYGGNLGLIWLQNDDGCWIGGNSIFDTTAPVAPYIPGQFTAPVPAWTATTIYGATFTASITTTVLTVTGTPVGTLKVGQLITGTGVTAGTQIISLGTGAGGAGTYNLNNSQSVGSESMTATGDLVINGGYKMQLSVQGTSGGSAPTIKPFGNAMTDGSATWLLAMQNGANSVFLDSGANEVIIDGVDMSGYLDYDFVTGDSLSTGGPSNVTLQNVTFGGSPIISTINLTGGQHISIVNSHITGPSIVGEQVIVQTTFTGALRMVNDHFLNYGVVNYGLFIQGGTDFLFTGNHFDNGRAFGTQNNPSHLTINGNIMNNVSHCLDITGASTDYVNFAGNDCGAGTISNSSPTMTHNFFINNPGYNPVGVTSGTFAPASTATYTGGPSPEMHYLNGGTVSSVKIPNNTGQQICAATPCNVQLGPNESFSVTYTAAPTDVKSIH